MMGYGQNGEFEDDEDGDEEVALALIAGAQNHADAQKILMMHQQD